VANLHAREANFPALRAHRGHVLQSDWSSAALWRVLCSPGTADGDVGNQLAAVTTLRQTDLHTGLIYVQVLGDDVNDLVP